MKYVLLMVLFGFFLLFPVSTVFAPPPPNHQHAFDYSENVIIGKILSFDILSEPKVTQSEKSFSERAGIALYEIKVEEYLKNPSREDIIKVPGYFSYNYDQSQIVIEPLYEVDERVFLYIQHDSHETLTDYDSIIRSYESRSLDKLGPICSELDTFYHQGDCREIPECGLNTKFSNGVCVVIPVDRNISMHGILGPLLLVILVGIIISPIYAFLKFREPINKFLFVVSIFIAGIILANTIYGEFFLVGDTGVAASANESFFFVFSILGSFGTTISFALLGIIYWKKNKNPNKIIVFCFFVIAIAPIFALMTGLLPQGASA